MIEYLNPQALNLPNLIYTQIVLTGNRKKKKYAEAESETPKRRRGIYFSQVYVSDISLST